MGVAIQRSDGTVQIPMQDARDLSCPPGNFLGFEIS